MVLVAVVAFAGLFFYRASTSADRRATERAELAREVEHMQTVNTWIQDTTFNTPVPGTAGWPAPTSGRAKRLWVINRMLVDGRVWERQVMERHGVKSDGPPPAWGTPRYWGDARAFPEVGTYLEGRAAAMAEIRKTSAARAEERAAALARESGLPAREIREIFPGDFGAGALDAAGLVDAMLRLHRHLVRVDPRVHHAGGNQLRWEREDDLSRSQELLARMNAAADSTKQAQARRLSREFAALAGAID
ncbi:MAG TPA: hypothetical protein VFJ82_23430 [Longimicrobium sp.]|nr:hypothetical protein [Longimicrobium sp.]